MLRYQGDAEIKQGDAVAKGDCFIESEGDPQPGPSATWTGRLSDPAPTANLVEGRAWLRLEDGRESEIEIRRAVAGSGLVEFSGAGGLEELR